MIITVAAATPGTPPSRMPRPPNGFSSMNAPAWVAILPAISLIGASSGSRPCGVLDRLVGDAGGSGVAQAPGQLRRRRQVQVGEQDLARAQQLDLLRLGLLHLQHQVGLGEDRGRVGHDAGALRLEVRRRRSSCPRRRRTGSAPRGRARVSSRTPAGVSATRYSSALISVGTPTFIAATPRSRRVDLEPGTRGAPAPGTGRRAATQRSGGSAPRASIRPRASSRTAAAAGAPVETTPPPSPQLGHGFGHGAHPDPRPPAVSLDDVDRDGVGGGGGGLRRGPRLRSGGDAGQLAQPLEQGRRQRQAEARLPAAEALAERAQLGVQRVDRGRGPDRLAEVHGPAVAEGLDLRCVPALAARPGASVSSSTSVWSA